MPKDPLSNRQHIVQKLFVPERVYLKHLADLGCEFEQPIVAQGALSAQQAATIFSDVSAKQGKIKSRQFFLFNDLLIKAKSHEEKHSDKLEFRGKIALDTKSQVDVKAIDLRMFPETSADGTSKTLSEPSAKVRHRVTITSLKGEPWYIIFDSAALQKSWIKTICERLERDAQLVRRVSATLQQNAGVDRDGRRASR